MTGEGFEVFVDHVDGSRWQVDLDFLSSPWRCVWADGCQGILDRPAPELGLGCCSVGAELIDDDEAKLLSALAATIDEERFQFAAHARRDGVFGDEQRRRTAVVDGACIFLNRPGFAGGAGCALHLQAIADGERPIDTKPSVCWQLPLRVEPTADGSRRLRRWTRDDWGAGAELAWWCTEAPEAMVGAPPAAEELAEVLTALVGPEVAVAIRRRVATL